MPLYEYNAKAADGSLIKGKMEANDVQNVMQSLREKNYYPLYVKPYSKALNFDLGDLRKIPVKDISIFCRQFSFILTAGISIVKALEIVSDQVDNVKLKRILNDVHENVQKGRSFSEAMKEHQGDLPPMLVNMIAVGETSGTLDKIMLRMADYYENEYKLKQKVAGAMTYPIVVCVFALIVVTCLVVFVLPTFVGMIQSSGGGELPLPTRIVLGISKFLRSYGILLLIIIVAVIIGIKIYKKHYPESSESFDRFKLSAPLFGKINKKMVTARFARTFGTLMASGVPIIESIEISMDIVGNQVIKNVLSNTKDEVRKGASMGSTLEREDVFPKMLTQMIKIGEESGTLDNVLEKTAQFYDGEVESATSQLTTLIEPILIIILAVLVGIIVLAMIMPIFQMYNAEMGS